MLTEEGARLTLVEKLSSADCANGASGGSTFRLAMHDGRTCDLHVWRQIDEAPLVGLSWRDMALLAVIAPADHPFAVVHEAAKARVVRFETIARDEADRIPCRRTDRATGHVPPWPIAGDLSGYRTSLAGRLLRATMPAHVYDQHVGDEPPLLDLEPGDLVEMMGASVWPVA